MVAPSTNFFQNVIFLLYKLWLKLAKLIKMKILDIFLKSLF
jgi:hypothetical protein